MDAWLGYKNRQYNGVYLLDRGIDQCCAGGDWLGYGLQCQTSKAVAFVRSTSCCKSSAGRGPDFAAGQAGDLLFQQNRPKAAA